MAQRNKLLEDIARELEQFSKDVAKEMAINTRDELYKEADNAINTFYSHYPSPLYYQRHTNPYVGYNIKKSIKKLYHSPHGTSFNGGIELSSEWMDDIYNTNRKKNYIHTDYIFNLIYAGYHGNVNMLPNYDGFVPPVMSPSPLELILNKRDELVEKAQINANKTALKLKKKNKYTYIS